MNLFVTGATGFIGSHFLKVNKEHELTCLKRKESSPRVEINKEYTWIIGELNNFQFDHLENKDALIMIHMKIAFIGMFLQLFNYLKKLSKKG